MFPTTAWPELEVIRELPGGARNEVHGLTTGWQQRPGSISAADLLAGYRRGGDIDLDAMPEQVVDYILEALAQAEPSNGCAVHGDAGVGNG
ncbi:hypothetical protein HGQ17_11555 [Nesterenkonia sp. MY13]|uniref:Uncharacterized protein n=1 Tax=Nesterenkonia sedimenti TaxID=1463632 RepID=A0A7X8YEG9_9MICC|nr:hypothetical protein [Nesterenkonia sedimenti]NLS10614.1 hypothetical protein [Nesterenkonia sedimenti]